MPLPSEESLDECAELFRNLLYQEIKRKLHSFKREDPIVRLEVDASQDVFTKVLGGLVECDMERGRSVYNLRSNRLLKQSSGLAMR